MGTQLARLLNAASDHPQPLSPQAVTALLAVAEVIGVPDPALRALVRRPELTREQARALLGPDPDSWAAVQFLCRPDTPTGEVLAALAAHSPEGPWFAASIAGATRDAVVLTALADHPEEQVLTAVVSNPGTPVPAAAAALDRRVALRTVGAQRVGWLVDPELDHLLRNPRRVRAAVLDAWALGTQDLDLLTIACHRSDVAADTVARLLDLALDALPKQRENIAGTPPMRALVAATRHPQAATALTGGRRERIQASSARMNGVPLAQVLGLTKRPVSPDGERTAARPWRATMRQAGREPEYAAAVLAVLADLVGDRDELWPVLARLAGEHTGTVSALVDIAAAVAAPADLG